jgi:DNA-binding HxlR family transcriptional regulator
MVTQLVQPACYCEVPPRVEYTATALARTLRPVFNTVAQWSDEYLGEVLAARDAYDAAEG